MTDSDDTVRRIIREVSGVTEFKDEDRLSEDLAIKSLDGVELCIALELRFHIDIEEESQACRTVGDVLRLVEKKVRAEA